MTDRTLKMGDTFPPLRGQATDENGVLDLRAASSIQVRLKSGTHLITGAAVPLDPSSDWNWQYTWASGDTDNAGTYAVELVVTWATGVVQTFPSDGALSVLIEPKATV